MSKIRNWEFRLRSQDKNTDSLIILACLRRFNNNLHDIFCDLLHTFSSKSWTLWSWTLLSGASSILGRGGSGEVHVYVYLNDFVRYFWMILGRCRWLQTSIVLSVHHTVVALDQHLVIALWSRADHVSLTWLISHTRCHIRRVIWLASRYAQQNTKLRPQCWVDVGPLSATLDQHQTSIRSKFRVCWALTCGAHYDVTHGVVTPHQSVPPPYGWAWPSVTVCVPGHRLTIDQLP